MAYKRGKLSLEEEQAIRDGIDQGREIHHIASQLNRSDEVVERFCNKNNLTYKGMSEEVYDDTVLRSKLEERPYWPEIQDQFTERELEYFIITWIKMMKQFREDILYSEELQVKQWITLEIMANKVMRDRRASQENIQRLDTLLNQEYNVAEELRDADVIARLETEKSALQNAMGSYTTEHAKILEKIDRVQKELKANRADRVKKIDDAKSSWSGFLRFLEDESNRQIVGEDIEVSRIAKDKAIERLSEYHTYEDGQVDQPILNCQTMKDN